MEAHACLLWRRRRAAVAAQQAAPCPNGGSARNCGTGRATVLHTFAGKPTGLSQAPAHCRRCSTCGHRPSAVMEPQPGVDYRLELGPSLLNKRSAGEPPELCTLRFDFKPQSAARATQGQLDVQLASQKVRRRSCRLPPLLPPGCCTVRTAPQAPTPRSPLHSALPMSTLYRRCPFRWARRPSPASGSPQRATVWTQWRFSTAHPSGWSCWAPR